MLSVQRTAAKDIHVKKVFVKYPEDYPCCDLCSFFNRTFRWNIGRIYKTRLDKPQRIPLPPLNPKWHIWRVRIGFHSAKEIIKKWNQDEEMGYLFIGKNKGSSYEISEKQFLENQVVIHECVIPKGSKYYVNEYGEYVSDQLIVLPIKENLED
jgi:hypothetical protein